MFRAVVMFCAVLALAKGQTTPVNRCLGINAAPLPINTYIAGCDSPPCELPQGQDAVVNIIFKAPATIFTMRTTATAFLAFVPLPYELGEKSVTCNFLANTYCPVVKGEVIEYILRMPIEDFMRVGTQLPIEFRIQDDNNRNIFCIRVVIRIISGAAFVGKIGARNATMSIEG